MWNQVERFFLLLLEPQPVHLQWFSWWPTDLIFPGKAQRKTAPFSYKQDGDFCWAKANFSPTLVFFFWTLFFSCVIFNSVFFFFFLDISISTPITQAWTCEVSCPSPSPSKVKVEEGKLFVTEDVSKGNSHFFLHSFFLFLLTVYWLTLLFRHWSLFYFGNVDWIQLPQFRGSGTISFGC